MTILLPQRVSLLELQATRPHVRTWRRPTVDGSVPGKYGLPPRDCQASLGDLAWTPYVSVGIPDLMHPRRDWARERRRRSSDSGPSASHLVRSTGQQSTTAYHRAVSTV